jgi:hypothetical protein
MVAAVGGSTPSGVLPHPERRLASPRAASCLTPSGVLPHPERRLASPGSIKATTGRGATTAQSEF